MRLPSFVAAVACASALASAGADPFSMAETNAALAQEAFSRCDRYVRGWLAHADTVSGLIPRNLTQSRDFWNGRDAAADNYPYMVLTTAMLDREALNGRMLQMLRTETKLTSRIGRLPDDYSFSQRTWRRSRVDVDAIVFEAAEYAKDGLIPVTEWLGESPWSERMSGMVDDIWKHAQVPTPFGKIPTTNFEVNGDLLQACSRLYWFTGKRKYFEWAARLADFYLLGTNHPTRHMQELRLVDHGCEVINGLTEAYVAARHIAPTKAEQWKVPLHEIFARVLATGRNSDGLLYSSFNPQTGAHSTTLCDTWGYVFDGAYTLWLIDGTEAYRDAVRKALSALGPKYFGTPWAEKNADSYADSIEGALNLLQREAVPEAAAWIDVQIKRMWAIQKEDGVIEGWHGDGNFARTSLMYAHWKTGGTTIDPWRDDVRFGAMMSSNALHVIVSAKRPWNGRLVFDQPRHETRMRLPLDYPRINQFPEWFTVTTGGERYTVQSGTITQTLRGQKLIRGLDLQVKAGEQLHLTISKKVKDK